MSREHRNKVFNILLGLGNMDIEQSRKIRESFVDNGILVGTLNFKYLKLGVTQYLSENTDVDVLIVAEFLESVSPYTSSDYIFLREHFENVLLIPIILDNHKGDAYVQELYQVGLLNALFQNDANLDEISNLILKPRTMKEARNYYGLHDILAEKTGANIASCREYISAAKNISELKNLVDYIKLTVTEREFITVLLGLSDEIKEQIYSFEEYAPYLASANENVVPEQKERKNTKVHIPIPVPIFKRREGQVREVVREVVKEIIVHEKADLAELVSGVMIGFAGIQRRVGTTTQILSAASFLKNKGFRVAVVELKENRNNSFHLMAKALGIEYTDTGFSYEGVDYYIDYDLSRMAVILSRKYNFILFDYGVYRQAIREDFLRCSKQIIVSSYSLWEEGLLLKFLNDLKKEEIGEFYYYFFLGNLSKDCRAIKEIKDYSSGVYEVEKVEDVFNSIGFSGTREVFKGFIDEEFDEVEEGFIGAIENNEIMSDKKKKLPFLLNSIEKSKERFVIKKKSPAVLRGIGVIFLTSLKHGAGCTQLGVAISNFLVDNNQSKVCFVNSSNKFLEGYLDPCVVRARDERFDDLYEGNDYLVFDRGVLGTLSVQELKELKRADYKIMLCLFDDEFLSALADFIREYGEGAKSWIYLFNILPKGKEREVKRLMQGYRTYCLPLFDIASTSKNKVQQIFSDIF